MSIMNMKRADRAIRPKNADATIFVVDDDDGMREAMEFLIEADGLSVKSFDSAKAFL